MIGIPSNLKDTRIQSVYFPSLSMKWDSERQENEKDFPVLTLSQQPELLIGIAECQTLRTTQQLEICLFRNTGIKWFSISLRTAHWDGIILIWGIEEEKLVKSATKSRENEEKTQFVKLQTI